MRPRSLPFVALASAVGLLAGAMTASAQTPQMPPAHEHIESGVTGPIVESADAMKVTTTIQCWCGGCVNQTLHECTCGLAASHRAKVAAALAEGLTPDQLIAAYVAEHGAQVRIVPERRGLNLIGWAVPFAATLAALVSLVLVLRGWSRRTLHAGSPAAAQAEEKASGCDAPALDAAYRARIARDLKEYDR